MLIWTISWILTWRLLWSWALNWLVLKLTSSYCSFPHWSSFAGTSWWVRTIQWMQTWSRRRKRRSQSWQWSERRTTSTPSLEGPLKSCQTSIPVNKFAQEWLLWAWWLLDHWRSRSSCPWWTGHPWRRCCWSSWSRRRSRSSKPRSASWIPKTICLTVPLKKSLVYATAGYCIEYQPWLDW